MKILTVSFLFAAAVLLPAVYYVWIPKCLIYLRPRLRGLKSMKIEFEKEFEQEPEEDARQGIWEGNLISGERRISFQMKTTAMLPSRQYYWNMYDQFVFLSRTLSDLLGKDDNIFEINLAVQMSGKIKYGYNRYVNN